MHLSYNNTSEPLVIHDWNLLHINSKSNQCLKATTAKWHVLRAERLDQLGTLRLLLLPGDGSQRHQREQGQSIPRFVN